jgi:phosphatidylglycerophosphate synthase
VITEATLYLATPEDADGALLSVAGQPVAFRALVAALRAGCDRVAVPDRFRGTDVERAVAASPRARAATVWLDGSAGPPVGPSLLLPAAVLVSVVDLHRIVRGEPATVLAPPDAHAAVVAADADLTRALWSQIREARPLDPTLGPLLAQRAARRAPVDWYVHVTDAHAARQAEALLYERLGSPIDTALDTAFHRRLSRPVTRMAITLGLTPNQVSMLSLVVGLLAVSRFWHATPLGAALGLILYAAAAVLDHSDGEVARLTLRESRLGEWLDVTTDTLVHGLLVLAMGMTTQRAAGRAGLALGVLAAIGIVVSAMIAKTSPRSAGTGVGGFLDALGSRDGFYAMLIVFILALAFAPSVLPVLMLIVTIGSHAYWLARLAYRLLDRCGAERGKERDSP